MIIHPFHLLLLALCFLLLLLFVTISFIVGCCRACLYATGHFLFLVVGVSVSILFITTSVCCAVIIIIVIGVVFAGIFIFSINFWWIFVLDFVCGIITQSTTVVRYSGY